MADVWAQNGLRALFACFPTFTNSKLGLQHQKFFCPGTFGNLDANFEEVNV